MTAFYNTILSGVLFIRNHPQIFLTVLLLIVVPAAFFLSGQQFLQASRQNQETLERSRIGSLLDAFIELSRDSLDDPQRLQEHLLRFTSQNEDVSAFRILSLAEGERTIVAALDQESIGKEDSENGAFYGAAGIDVDNSFIFEVFEGGVRHWKAFRAIVSGRQVIGFLYVDVSMEKIDALLSGNVQKAYIYLFFIVVVIFLLLLRHARIIDYTVLYQRLKEVDQMKDDFISIAAHELKTPITAIRGYADMLSQTKKVPGGDEKYIGQIDLSARQLISLVEDILDVSRLQQGRLSLDMQTIDPIEETRIAVESMKPVAEQKNLELSYAPVKEKVSISADEDRFRQVLINIIGNAVKYSWKGTIEIKTYIEKEKFFVRVIDTGIGISSEDQKQLFSKFFRVKSEETKHVRGTGLGLWITRQLVLQMKGDVAIESIKGVGTHVIVSFPLKKQNAA